MDSCQIFSFLFGTRKATSELRKCFSSKLNETMRGNKDKQQEPTVKIDLNCQGAANCQSQTAKCLAADRCEQEQQQQAPVSPIKQIQMKFARLASGTTSKFSSQPNDDYSIIQIGTKSNADCGTYRAILVERTVGDDDQHDDPCPAASQIRERIDKVPTSYIKQQQQDDKNIEATSSDEPKSVVGNSGINKEQITGSEVGGTTDLTHNKDEKLPVIISREKQQHQLSLDDKRIIADRESAKRVLFADKKNEKVRHLVQSFELTANATLASLHDYHHNNNSNNNSPSRRRILSCNPITSGRNASSLTSDDKPLVQNLSRVRPTTAVVKPLPPKTPPKSIKAKCLNWQLNLDKPANLNQLFKDERFLCRLFDQMESLDRCSAAQVCRQWRNVLYAKKIYWKDLVNVIDCTQLRREHIIDCIMNTLNQSFKLKQQQQQVKQHHSNNINCHQYSLHQQSQCNTILTAIGYNMSNEINELDQDEVWRIQDLCNRFSQKNPLQQASSFPLSRSALINSESQSTNQSTGSDNNNNNNNNNSSTTHDTNLSINQQPAPSTTTATVCRMTNSKSSSIPSQISSTLSSFSISSLLSPLSESSRVESLKEKLYTSMDNRGFEAICLFGANDEDIEDFTAKTPQGARQRIRVGRLNNCCLTDRGLGQFITTFNQIDDLELSGCNELTNAIDFRPLKNLTRLTITDCINIADGLAQRVIQVIHQLNDLIIQAYYLTDAFLEYVGLNADTSKLKRLELLNCKELTNQSMLTIAKHFQQLEALSISGSTKISDDGIELLTEQAKQVRCLDLSWCTKITDASLECIACDLSANLTELILDRNIHITDIGLGYLSTMNKLELVHIRWCSRITDIGLEAMLTSKSLKYLSLAGLHQITARSLLCLIESADTLLEVELTNCPAVNRDLLNFLEAKMPKCNIIY